MSELPYDYYMDVYKTYAHRIKEALKKAVREIPGISVTMTKYGSDKYRFLLKFETAEEQAPLLAEKLRAYMDKKTGLGITIIAHPERKRLIK